MNLATTADTAAALDRAVGALVGLAVGDAVGTTLEFTAKPATPVLFDMVGGGPFRLPPGGWTDDTSMALALADSLLHDADLDPCDLMDRFVSWHETGAYSHTGTCFDIGNTVRAALRHYRDTGDPIAGSTDAWSAGNGALMRLAPVAIRHPRDGERRRRVAALQTRTSQTPASVQRRYCRWTESQLPNSGGRSRHGTPVRVT
jgi:ADP-ribosyl-[dinitrogen reductase] hydrolase